MAQLYLKQLTFDGDDELWDHRKDFVPSMLQHVVDTLSGKELIWMLSLTESVIKQREVVVVIQLLYLHLNTLHHKTEEGGNPASLPTPEFTAS